MRRINITIDIPEPAITTPYVNISLWDNARVNPNTIKKIPKKKIFSVF